MNKEEIKEYIEKDIAYHCDEFGLERDATLVPVMLNICYRYKAGLISKEDLLECCKYLGFEIDGDQIAQNKREYYVKHHKVYAKKN